MSNPIDKSMVPFQTKPNLLVDGTITVQLKNGKHFTYRLYTIPCGNLQGLRVVELLVGPDNESDYRAFGFVMERGNIRLWKRFSGEAFVKHAGLLEGTHQDQVKTWYQAGRCLRCGHLLTDSISIERGLGPKCWQNS